MATLPFLMLVQSLHITKPTGRSQQQRMELNTLIQIIFNVFIIGQEQYCESGLFILDPDSISEPGSRIPDPTTIKNNLVAINFTKMKVINF